MKTGRGKDRSLLVRPSRRDPAVATVIRAWRTLTSPEGERAGPGERTLVACSGGADSSALVLALAAATDKIVVGHVMHDMRAAAEAMADRDSVRGLAAALGLEFADAAVSVKGKKDNAEALARRLRYRALGVLAAERGIGFVATGHHADDQLESVLMGLVRGAGPDGLRGVARQRRLARGDGEGDAGVWLLRPMLGVTRADCERICREAGWVWRVDATNKDRAHLRAALRHGVARDLAALRPGVEKRVSRTAALMRDVAGLVQDRVDRLLARAGADGPADFIWERDALRDERMIVLGSLFRRAAGVLMAGRGADRLGGRHIDQVVRAVRDRQQEPRRFDWHGIDVTVTARSVQMARKTE